MSKDENDGKGNQGGGGASGPKPKAYTIQVNGRQRVVDEKKQSYRDIVQLAYPDPNFETYMYTVTFLKGEGNREGDLVDGESVNVKDGMIFNVRRSDKS